jgi:hypothetical protein
MYHSGCIWQLFSRPSCLTIIWILLHKWFTNKTCKLFEGFKTYPKIICNFLIFQQIQVQMCENAEFMSFFIYGMNPTKAPISLSPLPYDCYNQCNQIHVHAGRNSTPDWSPRLLALGHFDWGWLQFLSVCVTGLVCFGWNAPLRKWDF